MVKPIFIPNLNQYRITVDSNVDIFFLKEDFYVQTEDWECLIEYLEPITTDSNFVHCCYRGPSLDIDEEDEWLMQEILNNKNL